VNNLTLDEIIDGLTELTQKETDISSYDIQVIEEAILELEGIRDGE
jgi:hypothetical protein